MAGNTGSLTLAAHLRGRITVGKPPRYRSRQRGPELAVNPRKHARRTVCIEARLFWRHEEPAILPCIIVDISEGGARIRAHFPSPVPPVVFLVKDEGEIIYECETVWQQDGTAGLMFVNLCAYQQRQELLKEIETAKIVCLSQN
jgi:hypothetical protein